MNRDFNFRGWPLTVLIIIAAIAISAFLWSIGIFFFFLPIIFLPFLKFVKFKPTKLQSNTCPVCGSISDGNYCSRCGAKLR